MSLMSEYARLVNIENRYANSQTVTKEELDDLIRAVNEGNYTKTRVWPTDTVAEPQTFDLPKVDTQTGEGLTFKANLQPGVNKLKVTPNDTGGARVEINYRYDDEDWVIESHPLYGVLTEAIRQAAYGKGERHGGAKTEFFEQPWYDLSKRFGVRGLLFQAAKKTGEAVGKTDYEAFEREVLGAIVYLGMSILRQREKSLEVPFNVV